MFPNLSVRERQVLDLLVDEEGISVKDLGKRLDVSAVTIRNILNQLSEKGVVVRTWGGATPAFHPEIVERQRSHPAAKAAIAARAAELVRDGDAIMVEAGTTTSLIGRHLLGKRDVHVVSNSMLFVPFARANPSLQLTIVGGTFHAMTESLLGPLALRELEQYHVRTAFVGTDGFSLRDGASTHLVEGAEIVRTMRDRAEQTVLLADSSKYGKVGFASVLGLNDISMIITDEGLPAEARDELAEAGVELVLVSL